MSRKISALLTVLFLGLCFQSKGQAPITGITDLCIGTTTSLNSTDPGGTWTSATTTVATIDAVGVVYGAGGGTSVITYGSSAGTVTTTVTVGVFPAPITGPAAVCEGVTINLSDPTPGGTWISDYATAATVNTTTGAVLGVNYTAAPFSTVTISYVTNCGTVTHVITVNPAMTPISGGAATVCQQATLPLSDATPGGAWSSSNTTIASVVGGIVTGGAVGAVVISYGNVCGTATYNVTVNQKPGPVNGVSGFCFGSTASLISSPTGGVWSSNNTLVALIDAAGVVTTTGMGSVIITYTLPNTCFSVFNLSVSNCPACPINSDFELGNYSNWKYYIGTCCPIVATTLLPTPPTAYIPCRFALTGPCPVVAPVVVCGNDPIGDFPVVGAGVYSLRVGSAQSNGQASKAVYYVHVPASSTTAYSLIYRYAVVVQSGGHSAAQQPRFTVTAYDSATNIKIPCADFTYVPPTSGAGLPGFNVSNHGAPPSGAGCTGGNYVNSQWKDWSTTSINLSGLGGATIRMEFAAAGCDVTQGAHWGYGYVDMTCGTFAISSLGCGDSVATVTAPSGFANYSWYDSATFTTLYGTTQTVTFPMPVTPTTFAVIMTPYVGFGCPDTLYTRIRPSNLQLHPSPDTTICAGQSTTISSNATDIALPLSYEWTPATGLSCATCANPIATPFAGVNVYAVIVTDDAGCSKSTTQKVTVDSVGANITPTPVSCFSFTDGRAVVTPTFGVAPFTYSWSTVPVQTTATATGLPIGSYTATINDSKGCSNTVTTTITQPPPLTMAIGGTTNPDSCNVPNGTITLTGLVPGALDTVEYRFTAAGTTTTVTTAGSYTVTPTGTIVITRLGKGVYDSIKILTSLCPYNTLGPITLADPLPPALPYVTSNSPVCVTQPLNLTTTCVTPGVSYTWAGPGGFTNTTQTPIKNPSQFSDSGWYIVTVMVDSCFSKDSTRVVIRDTPVPALNNNSPLCSGSDTVKLTSASNIGADFYVWNGPDGFISNFQNPIIINPTAAASGIYTVVITYQSCKGMGTTTVTVNQTPGPPIISDTNYCQNSFSPTFKADTLIAVGTNMQWYNAAGVPIPGSPTPMTNVVGHNTWYVDQTSNDTPPCKSGKTTVSVGIYAQPDPKFTISDSVFCQGTYFTFEARDVNTGVDYQGLTWSFTPVSSGVADIVNDVNPVIHSFNIADVVNVSVSVNYYVCPDTVLSHSVRVFPYPGLYLGQDTAICPGGEAIKLSGLTLDNAAATWLWSTGETSATINIVAPGTYYVKATISGCSTSDTIIVANDCYMNMPNVFTPNGDGVNDYFYPRQYLTRGLTSFTMNIYNRWGQVVFTSTSIEGRGWDGKFNDVPQPQGVFVYVVDATFKDGQKEHHQGNVTLLR